MDAWKSLLGKRAPSGRQILFVCTGNICRSAFAEQYARQCVGSARFDFASAGVGAVVGSGMDATVFEAGRSVGLMTSDHKARQLNGRILKDAVLVLVFDQEHMDWITSDYPEHLAKTYALGHLARMMSSLPDGARVEIDDVPEIRRALPLDSSIDWIPDPYRRGEEAAQRAVNEISRALETIAPHMF